MLRERASQSAAQAAAAMMRSSCVISASRRAQVRAAAPCASARCSAWRAPLTASCARRPTSFSNQARVVRWTSADRDPGDARASTRTRARHGSATARRIAPLQARSSLGSQSNSGYCCAGCASKDLGLIGNCQFSALVERTGDGRLVLPAALRLGAGLLDAAGPRARRAVPWSARPTARPGRPALPREHQRARDDLQTGESGIFPRARFRAALHPARPHLPPHAADPHRRAARRARRASACAASRGWAGPRRVRPQLQGSQPRALRGLREPLRLTTDMPLSYLGGQPVHPDRAPAPGAHLGRARSRSRCRRCATASWARPFATGSAGSSTATSRRSTSRR